VSRSSESASGEQRPADLPFRAGLSAKHIHKCKGNLCHVGWIPGNTSKIALPAKTEDSNLRDAPVYTDLFFRSRPMRQTKFAVNQQTASASQSPGGIRRAIFPRHTQCHITEPAQQAWGGGKTQPTATSKPGRAFPGWASLKKSASSHARHNGHTQRAAGHIFRGQPPTGRTFGPALGSIRSGPGNHKRADNISGGNTGHPRRNTNTVPLQSARLVKHSGGRFLVGSSLAAMTSSVPFNPRALLTLLQRKRRTAHRAPEPSFAKFHTHPGSLRGGRSATKTKLGHAPPSNG